MRGPSSLATFATLLTLSFAGGMSLVHCVGDSPATTTEQDAASADGTSPDGTGGDASNDAGNDAADAPAPKCVFPDAGTPGALDPSFQAQFYPKVFNSTAATFDSTGGIYVVGSDGNVQLCAGSSPADAYVVKMKNDGELETTFGTGGHLCVQPGASTYAFQAVAADSDGTLVAAGYARDDADASVAATQAFLARVTSTGQLDPSFGTAGTLVFPAITSDRSVAYAVALDTSVSPAKIVVAGANQTYFTTPPSKGWVMRFNHNGLPDLGFNGGNPVVDTGATNGYFGVAVVGGAIFVTGASGASFSQQTAIVRKLTNAGVFDPSFNGGNAVLVPIGASNAGQGDGVVALGTGVAVAGPAIADPISTGGPLAIAAITATGTVSSAFGTAGTTAISYAGQPLLFSNQFQFGVLASDCEGRLLVSTAVVADASANYDETAVVRVLTTGALDPAFGTGGIGVAAGFNSAAAGAPIEDPKTGGVLLVLRRRGGGLDAQLGLVRLNR